MTVREIISSLFGRLDNALPNGWGKWAGGGTIVLVLLYLAFVPTAIPVDTAVIERGPLEVTVTAEGRTRIRDIFTVSAPLTGRVLRVTLDPGDPVVGGETTVAIFEPAQPGFLDQRLQAQAQAGLANAKAAVIRARAESEFARSEYQRVGALKVGRTVTQTDVDLKKSLYDAAKASLDAAIATQAAAQAALISPTTRMGSETRDVDECCLRLIAPVDGEVLRVMQESERVMLAGAPILEVGHPDDLEVIVDLLSQDAVKVRPGATAYIDNWGGADSIKGLVRRVEPSGFTKISALGVEEQRVNVIIDLDPSEVGWHGLRGSYRVEPRIVVWSHPSVLLLPLSALFRVGDQWAVYRLDGRTARLQLISIGQRNGDFAEITAGLEIGDGVVRHPSEDVADGTRIVLR